MPALQAAAKQVTVQVELDIPPHLELDSYPGQLSQVLQALFENSAAHGFAGLGKGHGDDDGNGIAPEHLGRVYDPFFTTRRGTGGSGLGLYIAHNIVTSVLGGRIKLASEPGNEVEIRMKTLLASLLLLCCTALSAAQSPEVAAVLQERAASCGAELRWVEPLDLGPWVLGIPGAIQASNGAVALGMLHALTERGWAISASAIRTGFAQARWPGRLQQLPWRGHDLLLDG
eukprot:gene28576-32277_t